MGPPPKEHVEAQLRFYRGYTPEDRQRHWGEEAFVNAGDGAELAERLLDIAARSHCESLNLRVHLNGLPAEAMRDQIQAVGEEVLPALRRGLHAQLAGSA